MYFGIKNFSCFELNGIIMKKFFISCLVLFLHTSMYSQHTRFDAYSGTLVFSVEGGTSIAATDYIGSQLDYMGKAALEFFIPAHSRSSFGLRIFGNSGFISEREESRTPAIFRTSVSTFGAGAVYIIKAGESFFPYFFTGAGYLWFEPNDDNGRPLPGNRRNEYEKREINYLGELGMRILITDNLSFNLSAGTQISPYDYWDDSREGATNDLMFTVMGGLSFSFFTEKDSDSDGIADSKDLCPGTPAGLKVDASGCPPDEDKDGIPDYRDKCLRTPSKVQVDKDGCPVDSDGDGVPDYIDVCPGTPAGMLVDRSGCPNDQDMDGVPDNIDKCPDTPVNVEVDEDGCPFDDDLDGVPDYLDKCPRTPAGEKVDEHGCSVKGDIIRVEPDKTEVILSAGASFASGSTTILPSAYEELNKLVYEMKENPVSRWKIEGYTDNIGSDETNRRISLKRAEAVRDYFVSRGINSSRFEVLGFGKGNPVASNDTEEGRAKNRRVRIIRLN
jgi:outer membrane protein OmpA-like peptidoglycan-associated protein